MIRIRLRRSSTGLAMSALKCLPNRARTNATVSFCFSSATQRELAHPFVTDKPPYQRRQWEGEFTGPINKKTSFFMDFERRDINENAFINALTLDQSLNVTPLRRE